MLTVGRATWRRFLTIFCCAIICAASFSFLTPGPVAADLVIGGTAVVITTEGDSLSVRGGPGRQHPIIGALPERTVVALIGGPVTSEDGIVWFQINWRTLTGWCSAEWLGQPGQVAAAENVPQPPAAPAAPPPAPVAPPAPTQVPAAPQPTTGAGPKITGTNGYGARLRATPSLRAAILLVIPEGSIVEPIGAPQSSEGYEWMPVRFNGQTGWVANSLLSASTLAAPSTAPQPTQAPPAAPPSVAPAPTPTPPPAAPVPPAATAGGLNPGERARVVGTEGLPLRIRHWPGLDAPINATIPAGGVVQVIGAVRADNTGAPWNAVDYQGAQGWVLTEHLQRTDAPATARQAPTPTPTPAPTPRPTATPTPSVAPTVQPGAPAPQSAPQSTAPAAANGDRGQAIVNTAMRYLGAPYVYGGATPAGWDCSGFVLYIYKEAAGISLPRSAAQQYRVGTAIPADQVRAGDIVYFSDTFGPGITHDGIALGDGRFIHARSEAFGTVINSLSDPYWSAHYAGARRP